MTMPRQAGNILGRKRTNGLKRERNKEAGGAPGKVPSLLICSTGKTGAIERREGKGFGFVMKIEDGHSVMIVFAVGGPRPRPLTPRLIGISLHWHYSPLARVGTVDVLSCLIRLKGHI